MADDDKQPEPLELSVAQASEPRNTITPDANLLETPVVRNFEDAPVAQSRPISPQLNKTALVRQKAGDEDEEMMFESEDEICDTFYATRDVRVSEDPKDTPSKPKARDLVRVTDNTRAAPDPGCLPFEKMAVTVTINETMPLAEQPKATPRELHKKDLSKSLTIDQSIVDEDASFLMDGELGMTPMILA